jgi:hypothetical protein
MNETLSKLLTKTLETLRKEDKAIYDMEFRKDVRSIADSIELFLVKQGADKTDAK